MEGRTLWIFIAVHSGEIAQNEHELKFKAFSQLGWTSEGEAWDNLLCPEGQFFHY